MIYTVKQGDVLTVTQEYPDNYFDGLFCDPPYGLSFMGKGWDTFKAGYFEEESKRRGHKHPERQGRAMYAGEYDQSRKGHLGFQEFMYQWAKETWRILKPGAFGLVFGGTRTWHRLAVALEDAGFEIRDTLMWIYGSGFPKSYDISKGIDKHGGQAVGWFGEWLRKWRTENSITQKQIAELFPSKTGGLTGCVANWELGLNMPTCEQFNTICKAFNLPFDSLEEAEREVVGRDKNWGKKGSVPLTGYREFNITIPATDPAQRWQGYGTALKPSWEPVLLIRKPLDGNNAQNALKHGCGGLNIDGGRVKSEHWYSKPEGEKHPLGDWPANLVMDKILDNVPHYFYCAKASSSERNAGLEGFEETTTDDGREKSIDNAYQRGETLRCNHHPTVKPLDLCRYLAKLILPPEREGDPRKLLVPFAGSGSEMIGSLQAGWDEVDGIEIDPEYCKIAEARLTYWCKREKEKIPF